MPSEEQVRDAQASRLRFLNAAYDREDAGEHMPRADLIAVDAGMNADDWTAIERATEALRGDGLITGAGTAELGLVRVKVTPLGRRLVESKAAGHEPPSGSPASIGDVRIDGSGNVITIQQHSPGATQQVEIAAYDKRKMLEWVDDVEARVADHGLTEVDEAEVREQVAELRRELEKANPDPVKVRAIGKLATRILTSTMAGLSTAGLIEAGQALFS
jgi:hypothetical protein